MNFKGQYKFFAVGALGTFMATLDGSILNVSLPSIARDLDCDVGLVAWVVLSYSLTLVSLLMVFGAWAQRKGYGFAYRFGYVFFLIGSSLCAVSNSIEMLIISRVIQATGTAMFAAVGPGMVTAVFPAEQRGKGIGLMVMMVSAGFMSGPPLGGFILSVADWNMIFLINIPIGLVGLWMTWRFFGGYQEKLTKRPLGLLSPLCSSTGLVTGIFALSLVDEMSLSDPRLWGLGLVSILFLIAFVVLEKNPERALIGLNIFRNRNFTASLAAQLAHFAGLSGVLVLVPFYLEQVQHLKPRQVGLYLVILPIMMFLVAPLTGRLSDKIGFKLLTTGGMLVLGVGLWLMTGLSPATGSQYMIGTLVVIGLGVGMFTTPNSSALMGSVPADQQAAASGIMATNRNIGMSVGVALATGVFAFYQQKYAVEYAFADGFVHSLQPVVYVSLVLIGIGLIASLVRSNRVGGSSEALASPGQKP